MKLLTSPEANPKIAKNIELGYLTAPLHLAPYNLSGYQVCPMASKGCAAACLNTAGHGIYKKVQDARIRKTKLYFEDRKMFMEILRKDIKALVRKAEKLSLKPAVRLNATSDIPWENSGIMDEFPDVQFYDYFKTKNRAKKSLPKNYHLTFSLSETNLKDSEELYALGFNVAVVFFGRSLPENFSLGKHKNLTVLDGDKSDCRFLDGRGIVGLLAKGKGKKDSTGFVKLV